MLQECFPHSFHDQDELLVLCWLFFSGSVSATALRSYAKELSFPSPLLERAVPLILLSSAYFGWKFPSFPSTKHWTEEQWWVHWVFQQVTVEMEEKNQLTGHLQGKLTTLEKRLEENLSGDEHVRELLQEVIVCHL